MAIFFDEFKHLKIQLEEIKSAMDNFGDNNLIGRGGFGKVYKGTISHSKGKSMVAFKRLDSALGQGNSEFWKEITMLSRYTHENLVSLLGYCDEGDEKILVYEYASRGSLDRHLSDTALTWMQRLRICLGAARGLSYLHDPKGTQQRVLHRDIKSSNILLNQNWNAKVSDFGLSRISPANQPHTILISNMVGTVGYLDPLYLEMGLLTKESDVYSFGVVLFEVLCGRLCYEFSNSRCQTLVRLWKKSYKENKLDEIIFQDMLQQIDPSSLKTFSDIACLCLHKSLEERPVMARVVKELEIALEHQVTYYEQQIDYEEMNRNQTEVPPPLIHIPKEEPEMLLSKENLLYAGKAEKGRSIRRFWDWYENDPSSTEGFTHIFNQVREMNRAAVKNHHKHHHPRRHEMLKEGICEVHDAYMWIGFAKRSLLSLEKGYLANFRIAIHVKLSTSFCGKHRVEENETNQTDFSKILQFLTKVQSCHFVVPQRLKFEPPDRSAFWTMPSQHPYLYSQQWIYVLEVQRCIVGLLPE